MSVKTTNGVHNVTMYHPRDLKKESYDDRKVKEKVIEKALELVGFELQLNNRNLIESTFGIDLISVENPMIGVEVERGGPVYGHWEDSYYSTVLQYENPNYPEKSLKQFLSTINRPDRKDYMWKEYYQRWNYEYGYWIDKELVYNPSFDKNIFIRSDYFFHQFIVVLPEVNLNKSITLSKEKKVQNNTRPEIWRSWEKKHVLTFNSINDKLVLETSDLSTHLPPITEEYRKELEMLKYKEKKEQEKMKNEANTSRASSVYKSMKKRY